MNILVDDLYILLPGYYLFCMHGSSGDRVYHENVYAQTSPQELVNEASKSKTEATQQVLIHTKTHTQNHEFD